MPPLKMCPTCKRPAELTEQQCPGCGHLYRTVFQPEPERTQMLLPPETPTAPPPVRRPEYPAPPQYYHPSEPTRYDPLPPYNPPAPNPYAPPQKMDLCAILATCFGFMGVWAYGACVFGPAAVILGIVALHRINDNPGLKGKHLAWIGIAGGILSTLWATYAFQRFLETLSSSGGG
jgi:hypothetical protein